MFKYQTIIILLLVLGAATCFIAYMSDQLGMKLGKKRISLNVGRFSLRPRQTATALSMASSLAVMIVTMLVLLAINPSLRQGLLYYDEARRENARLSGLNAELKTQSDQQSNAIKKQTQSNQQLENSLRGKNLQLVGLNNRVSQTQQQVNAAQQQLDAAQHNLHSAQSEREAAQHARDAAQSARDAAQAAQNRAQAGQQQARQGEAQARAGFQEAQSRFQAAQARFVQAQQQEKIARQRVTTARTELHSANAQLSSTQSKLANARVLLNAAKQQTATAQRQAANAQRQTLDAQRQTAETMRLKANANAQLAIAAQNLSIAKGVLSGEIKVIVPAGQVFSAATIPAQTNSAQVLDILHKLLAQAAQNARAMNFQSINLDMTSFRQDDPIADLSEEQQLKLAADVYAAQTPISVRIVAARDHPEGETELVVRPFGVEVHSAFTSGEVIAQTTINGSQSGAQGDAQVFNRLLSLLDEGQKVAAARGVAPIPSTAEPNIYASDTRLSIFQALRQIQQKGGEVPVRLVAATALSTIEPVHIRIEVGDATSTSDATPGITPDKVSGAPQKT